MLGEGSASQAAGGPAAPRPARKAPPGFHPPEGRRLGRGAEGEPARRAPRAALHPAFHAGVPTPSSRGRGVGAVKLREAADDGSWGALCTATPRGGLGAGVKGQGNRSAAGGDWKAGGRGRGGRERPRGEGGPQLGEETGGRRKRNEGRASGRGEGAQNFSGSWAGDTWQRKCKPLCLRRSSPTLRWLSIPLQPQPYFFPVLAEASPFPS